MGPMETRQAGPIQAAVDALIEALFQDDARERQQARRALVALGEAAVEPLTRLMANQDVDVRWEAVKALADIQAPAAVPELVCALADKDSGIRWMAAEGLIALGHEALAPLLRALVQDPDSDFLREGAHHVLRKLSRGMRGTLITPILEALSRTDSEEDIILTANAALTRLNTP